jgi:hypothetical protein
MTIDRTTRARARRALREALSRIHDPNVTLIDFGQARVGGRLVEDKLAIRFHVRRKLGEAALQGAIEAGSTERVPERMGDFPTDVLEGSFRPHRLSSWWWRGGRGEGDSGATCVDPTRCGVSLFAESQDTYGTLGGLVVDSATGERMLLSNWRVLAPDWSARVSPRIYQRARGDEGHDTASPSRDAIPREHDAAVVVLNGSLALAGEPLGLGAVRVGQAEIGMEVVKSGGRTGITCGVVRGVDGIARMSYASRERVIRDVVTIESRTPGGEASGPGDSGSLWLDRASLGVIGLHFAGSRSPERGLAVAMQPVLDSLGVDIVIEHRGVSAVLRRVSIPV